MAHIEWKAIYSVGVEELDTQHKSLLDIVNRLDAMSVAAPMAKGKFFAVVSELTRYADIHFSTEERYLRDAGYPGLSGQEEDHVAFTVRIFDLARRMDNNDPTVYPEILRFVQNWYMNHILGSDQEYKEFLASRRADEHH